VKFIFSHTDVDHPSARMSKITNDDLTRSGTRCFIIAVPYGNSGRQRIETVDITHTILFIFYSVKTIVVMAAILQELGKSCQSDVYGMYM